MKKVAMILMAALLLAPAAPILNANTTGDKTTVVAEAKQQTVMARVCWDTDIHYSPTYQSPATGHLDKGYVRVYTNFRNGFAELTQGGWVSLDAIHIEG